MEPYDRVWLHGCIVHQHFLFLDGVSGWKILFSTDLVECDKHDGVDGSIDVEKGGGDAFHVHDAAFVKFRCGRGVGIVLHLVPICRRKLFVGRVFRARGYGVLEALQGFVDGVGHVDVDVIFQVVPIYGKAAVLAAIRIDGDGVILPEGVEEVGGIVGGK